MAVPENYKKLAVIGMAWKGKYLPDAQYKYMNGVTCEGSSYVALKDNPSGPPKDDGINWQMTASKGDDGRIDADSKEVFDSKDDLDPKEWTDVPLLESGESHKSVLFKISTMFKNARYILKLLGSTDISTIGNGTVTGALSELNSNLIKSTTFHWSGETIKDSRFSLGNIYDIIPEGSTFIGAFLVRCFGYNNLDFLNIMLDKNSDKLLAKSTVTQTSVHVYINVLYV